MNLIKNIETNFLKLQPSLTIKEALVLFKKNKTLTLTVVENDTFLGLLDFKSIKNITNEDFIYQHSKLYIPAFVKSNASIQEVMECFVNFNNDQIAILDFNTTSFLGLYSKKDFLTAVKNLPFIKEKGETLVLSHATSAYSLSVVSQIAEQHNGKILCIYLSDLSETKVEITLKLIAPNLKETIRVLQNHGYKIVSFHQEDLSKDVLNQRYNYLNKFLSI